MSEELKHCPFCKAEAEQQYQIFMGGNKYLPFARCTKRSCIAHKIWFPIEGWNTRYDGWQPIETAPKDGTHIQAWDKQYGLYETWWGSSNHIVHPLFGKFKEDFWWISKSGKPEYYEPTHWRPLPEPPEDK